MANTPYLTKCDMCSGETWYETEQQCHRSYPKATTCETCFHTEYDHDRILRCTGTLRVIDHSELAPQFTSYLHDYSHRLEVQSPSGYVRRGYVGKTTGIRPVYMLLAKTNSTGSSDLLRADDRIIRIIKK